MLLDEIPNKFLFLVVNPTAMSNPYLKGVKPSNYFSWFPPASISLS